MIVSATNPFASWPSAAASISLGATLFVTTTPTDKGIRSEIAKLPTVVEDPLFGGFVTLSLFLGLYVIGQLILSFCNQTRRYFDPNETARFRYMMKEASEREYIEWKSIELRTQIIFAALAILVLILRNNVQVIVSGYPPETWQSQIAGVIYTLVVIGGFLAMMRQYGADPYKRLDEVVLRDVSKK